MPVEQHIQEVGFPDKYTISAIRESDFVHIDGMNLYAPRPFKATTMMVGNSESHIALCTGWSDPWQVVSEDNIETFSIVAPLRTPMGVNVLLWNLAQNPQVTCLAVWAGNKLDKTSKGSLAREYLLSLWENGIEDDGKIVGTEFKLLPELVENDGIEIIRKIVSNVALVDQSELNEAELSQVGRIPKNAPYMEPHTFPEFKIKSPETYPSEKVGLEVREDTLIGAWVKLLDRIMRYGKSVQLETGGAAVRELEFPTVVIESEDLDNFFLPQWAENISELRLNREGFESYFQTRVLPHPYIQEIYPGVNKFVRGPKDPSYLYSELLFFFPRPKAVDVQANWVLDNFGIDTAYRMLSESYAVTAENAELARRVLSDPNIENGKKRLEVLMEIFIPPVNQVAKAIERTTKTPDDADKTFVLWDPADHGMRDRGRPCLVYAAYLVRDGCIDMEVTWRSHDAAKGWPENLYGMLKLQEYIAQQTGYKRGKLLSTSNTLHIYQGDISWVERVLREQFIDKKIRKVFDEKTADPRGNMNITVVGNEIVCVLQEPLNSTPLMEFRGTYKDIYYELVKYDVLSQGKHWLDIGSELQKAEICRRLRIPYIQDKPFELSV